MGYNYQTEKPKIFTEEWQSRFLKIRDNVMKHIASAGCVRMDKAINIISGSDWTRMACVDRLVELNEIIEITDESSYGQYRIFTYHE